MLASAGNATANVMQRKASLSQPDLPFGPRLLLALVRSPTWLLGFAGLVGSFVLQAIALSYGELSAVEPIITLEVPLTLLVASRVFSGRLSGYDWASILIMTGGMIVLVWSLDPSGGNATDVDHLTYVAAGTATAATIVVLILASRRGGRLWRTACLGAAAGTSFGMTATLIKETVEKLSRDGVAGIAHDLADLCRRVLRHLGAGPRPGGTARGSARGRAARVHARWIRSSSILWGVLVFNEVTQTGGWLVLATLGAAGVGYGVLRLARSPLLVEVKEELRPTVRGAPPGRKRLTTGRRSRRRSAGTARPAPCAGADACARSRAGRRISAPPDLTSARSDALSASALTVTDRIDPPTPDLYGLDAWRTLPAAQQPSWPDEVVLREVALTLAGQPPLVVASEVDQLRERLAAVARGRGVPAAGRRLRRDVRDELAGRHRRQGAGAAADGGRADLRRVDAGGEARPDRRAVRQAALVRPRRDRPAVLPRRHGQRARRRPHAGPAAHAAGLLRPPPRR